jgi:hypothetical protein
MTPDKMYADALGAIQYGTRVTLVFPRPFKRPPKFPRGELLCCHEKSNVYSFDPKKIIKWLCENNLLILPPQEDQK